MVTDEDRKAAASVAVLVEMRELILAGKADHHAEPFARHRIAALEHAANLCDTLAETTYDTADGFDAATGCAAFIRAMQGE